MKITAVIMAGGKGERFWPKSRINLPKQFLSLTGDGKTMIQHTVNRLLAMIDIDDIFVVTNKLYVDLVKNQLPELHKKNILVEPIGKNTAPCVGLASAVINKKYDDAIMVVLPSDHLIKHDELYLDILKKAIKVAQKNDNLVTIGVTPSYPETGYGYIFFSKSDKYSDCYKVKQFVEKPNMEKAKEYLSSGQYLWNSGMFIWKVSTIMESFRKYMPDLYYGLIKIKNAIGAPDYDDVILECFDKFHAQSIDYGLMERADNIFTVVGDFGWDDVGSWLALERINKTDDNGNVFLSNGDDYIVDINSKGCIISSNKKLISVVGLKDIVIVDSDDALLVCNKDSTQQVKDIILKLKQDNKGHLL